MIRKKLFGYFTEKKKIIIYIQKNNYKIREIKRKS